MAESEQIAAAFFDMDGTIVRTNLVHSYMFNAAHEPFFPKAVAKSAFGLAKIPLFWAVDQVDRIAFNELLFSGYKDMYEDRLLEYAEEHFEKVLKPNIFPGAYELVEAGKKKGLRQVIISGSLDFLVAPLCRHMGFDDMMTNRLEFRKGIATGELVPPILAGANKARLIQEYAKTHNIDLLNSYGFSDSFSDYPMLAVLGRPAAVNPDRKLRRSARSFDWPVLDLS